MYICIDLMCSIYEHHERVFVRLWLVYVMKPLVHVYAYYIYLLILKRLKRMGGGFRPLSFIVVKKLYIFLFFSSPELLWSPFVRSLSVCMYVRMKNFLMFDFFSKTTGPISTKLSTKHPWVKGIPVCSNEVPRPFPRR